MAITHYGSIGVPADNGAQAGPTASFANPPIASMAAGDLVVIVAAYRGTGQTLAIGNAGGQSWTSNTNHNSSTATLTIRSFYCVFNGTWSAAPTVTVTSGTLAITAVMHVFRPTSGFTWSVVGINNPISQSAPGSPFTCTATSSSSGASGAFGIGVIATDDDNTWGTLASNWTQLGTGQYRNTQGNDTSIYFGYWLTDPGGNMTIRQATNGGDPYVEHALIFAATSSSISVTPGDGVLAATGFVPTVTASNHQTVTPGLGAAVLNGLAPTVQIGNNVFPGVGVAIVTGFEPTVQVSNNQRIDTATGQAEIVGLVPIVAVTNNQTIETALGQLNVTGFAPVVELPVVVQTDMGQVNAVGFEPVIAVSDHKTITPDTALALLEGLVPSVAVSNNILVTAALGEIVATGFAPTVSVSNNVQVDTALGEANLLGFAPSVQIPVLVETQTGVAVLNGFAPQVQAGNNVSADTSTGQAVIDGFAPTIAITNHIIVETGAGAGLLSGLAPLVEISDGQAVVTGTGVLAVTGFAPDIQTTNHVRVEPDLGQLLILGLAPTVQAAANVVAETGIGLVVLEGFAPVVTADQPFNGLDLERTTYKMLVSNQINHILLQAAPLVINLNSNSDQMALLEEQNQIILERSLDKMKVRPIEDGISLG
jgi:hypothetical protein